MSNEQKSHNAFDLAESDDNLFVVEYMGKYKFGLFHKSVPTTGRIAYQSEIFKGIADKVSDEDAAEIRYKHAKKYITGIREGDFCYKNKVISSDPKSPNYDELWFERLKNNGVGGRILDYFVQYNLGDQGMSVNKKESGLPLADN